MPPFTDCWLTIIQRVSVSGAWLADGRGGRRACELGAGVSR